MKQKKIGILLLSLLALVSCNPGSGSPVESTSSPIEETFSFSIPEEEIHVLVSFDYQLEGVDSITKEYTYHQPYTLPEVELPEPYQDYSFKGWYSNDTLIPQSGESFPLKENVTLKARYSLPGFTFRENPDHISATLVSYSGKQSYVEIPSYFNGLKVTKLSSSAFSENHDMTALIIPDTIEEIGKECFSGCTSLSDLTLGKGITSIGDDAFFSCPKLRDVHYQGDLSSWMKITFGDYSNPLVNKAKLYFKDVLVEEISIPETFSSIPSSCFVGCTSLRKVIMPETVLSIGSNAFENCSNLEKVVLSTSLYEIPAYAFDGCKKLNHITLPSGITYLGEHSFSNCSALTSINLPSQIKEIPEACFSGDSKLSGITLPKETIKIGTSAFESCTSLEEVSFDTELQEIGRSAFSSCARLKTLSLPSSVTSIGTAAFSTTPGLESIEVDPSNTTYSSSGNCLIRTFPA